MIGLSANDGSRPRAFHPSTIVGILVVCLLGAIWGIAAWVIVGERREAIAQSERTLSAFAAAYEEHASTLEQTGTVLPHDESRLTKVEAAQPGEISLRE